MPEAFQKEYGVATSSSSDINEIKRALHGNMFVCVNMCVTKDIYNLDGENFLYNGTGQKAGGHSMVCCGYDEDSRMLIMQNHWGTIWGLKGFFLCPYDVWKRQNNLICWYERTAQQTKPAKKQVKKVEEPAPPAVESVEVKTDDALVNSSTNPISEKVNET